MKLENTPKKHPFKVPENYFDELPVIIQSRVAEKSPSQTRSGYVGFALKYALPAVVLVVAFFVFRPAPGYSAEELLASVETEDLVSYLALSDITMDEIIDEAEFSTETVQAIEDEVYFNFDELNLDDLYLDDIELDSGNNL
jgi:hypothetical protein